MFLIKKYVYFIYFNPTYVFTVGRVAWRFLFSEF